MSSPLYLLKTKRFAPLFGVQFLGAFNDNIFKNTLAIIVTFHALSWTELPLDILAPLIGAIFIVPFFIFSGVCGAIADTFDKAYIARLVKVLEIVLMGIALVGFLMHSFWLLLVVVFGMGFHSTLFGPIKYAIIPQHVEENELIVANALVEAGTFIAILLGTIGGGMIASLENSGLVGGMLGLFIAGMGYALSRYIPSAPSSLGVSRVSLNIITQTVSALRLAFSNTIVFMAIMAISFFWFYGALLLSQFPAFVKVVLLGSEHTVTLLLALFTVGIGVGSFLCEKLSHHTIRPSLVIIGACGMLVFGVDFSWSSASFVAPKELYSSVAFWHIMADLVMIGLFGGFFSVPLYALMQGKSDVSIRSRIIAANNILNALFMVLGAVATMVLLGKGWSIPHIFLAMSVLTGMATILIGWAIYRVLKSR